MSFTTPEIGDNHWPQYAVVDDLPVKADLDIQKGSLYAIDDDGFVVKITAAGGHSNNLSQAVQSMVNSVAVSGEDDGSRLIDCLFRRSRVILKAVADLTVNKFVEVDATLTAVTDNKVKLFSSGGVNIGSIFELLDGKKKTVNNDLIVVDLI